MSLNKFPFVSICIVSFNHENYVARCLESCLSQTYKNIEIIIVDNGSIDNSVNVIKGYVAQSESIQFFSLKDNIFTSAGFNYAIKKAKGEYISLVSADDYYELNKVERQLNYMVTKGLSNCFTWINAVDESNNIIEDTGFSSLFNRSFTDMELKRHFILYGNTLCAPSIMLHKSIFEKYGFFDHRLLQLQDYDLWLRVLIKEPLNILPEKLTNYCVRSDNGNLSSSTDDKVIFRSDFEQMQMMKYILEFDLESLSSAIGETCTIDNKYSKLLDYYISENNDIYADGILCALYECFCSNFEQPSLKYNMFLERYSVYDLFKHQLIRDKDLQLKIKDEKIKNLEQKVEYWYDLAHSLRLKSRLRRVIKIFIPSFGMNSES